MWLTSPRRTPSRAALPGDKYVWGSITKMFTGPAVLQLVEAGVIKLSDPISVHDPRGLTGVDV